MITLLLSKLGAIFILIVKKDHNYFKANFYLCFTVYIHLTIYDSEKHSFGAQFIKNKCLFFYSTNHTHPKF